MTFVGSESQEAVSGRCQQGLGLGQAEVRGQGRGWEGVREPGGVVLVPGPSWASDLGRLVPSRSKGLRAAPQRRGVAWALSLRLRV